MRLEGRGRYEHLCAGCNTPFPNFRCKDCIHGALWCQACLVKRHPQSPLHVIEVRFLFLFVSDGCNVVVEWPLFSAVFMFSSVIPPVITVLQNTWAQRFHCDWHKRYSLCSCQFLPMCSSWTLVTATLHGVVASHSTRTPDMCYHGSFATLPSAQSTRQWHRLQFLSHIGVSNR